MHIDEIIYNVHVVYLDYLLMIYLDNKIFDR